MLEKYNLKMPHAVYSGENAMDNVTDIIRARGAKKVAIFTDKGIEAVGLFALPEAAVKASGAEYYVLDENGRPKAEYNENGFLICLHLDQKQMENYASSRIWVFSEEGFENTDDKKLVLRLAYSVDDYK